MKKFLLFLVVAISAISIGLSIYYFSVDNEVIYIKNSYLIVDVDDTISTDGLLGFQYKDENTKLSYSFSQESDVLEFKSGDSYFLAVNAGKSQIVITTTNRHYPKLVIDVLVCDGSEEFPFIISSQEELQNIGKDKYTLQSSYQLANDIVFIPNDEGNWTPLSNFSGTFDGNYYTISNLSIVDQTSPNPIGFISTLESNGVVKNLFLENINIISDTSIYVGSVVGKNFGTVQTTEVTGYIQSNNAEESYVGGIVGINSYLTDKRAKVDRCGFEGSIVLNDSSEKQFGGGVVGYNLSSDVSESYYRGTQENFIQNNRALFGGIVGKNEASTLGLSNIYDSYFYLDNVNENVNFNTLAGIVYLDIQSASQDNIIIGNYYGGNVEQDKFINGAIRQGEELNAKSNGFLSVQGFTTRDNFVTYISTNTSAKQTWDFNSVWTMGDKYPLLNIYSASGSKYPDDISDIVGNNSISTPQELYDALNSTDEDASFVIISDIDFQGQFVWGDESHPIPEQFNGTLTCLENVTIKNLTILNNTESANVGLVRELGPNAVINGFNISGVIIQGEDANSLGVLAGINNGASVYDVSISDVTVHINGNNFGALFGINFGFEGHSIRNIEIANITAGNAYFVISGGMVGQNYGDISVSKMVEQDIYYNLVRDVKLYGNLVGGIAGVNDSSISYTKTSAVSFKEIQGIKNLIYNQDYDIMVGGAVGYNNSNGNITEVYAQLYTDLTAGSFYNISAGGLVGYNTGNITRTYSYDVYIQVKETYLSYLGGLVGFNDTGKISRSVVNGGDIISSTSTRSTNLQAGEICSVVGGLVGIDYYTTSSYSISECSSRINQVKGFYAGGLVGIASGKIERCFVGTSSKSVRISGFIVGGLCATVQGSLVDSYTICELSGEFTNNKFENMYSILNFNVSGVAGISVFALTGSHIQGCYTVATFKDGGEKFSTFADISKIAKQGEIKGCVYVNKPSENSSIGTMLSQAELTGSVNPTKFYKSIGSQDNSVWVLVTGEYPKIANLDANLPRQ